MKKRYNKIEQPIHYLAAMYWLSSVAIHKGDKNMISGVKKIITDKMYLIFDLDGTLINTNKANFLSYQEAIKNVKNIDLNLIYDNKERFTRDKLKSFIPHLTVQEFEKIIKMKTNLFQKYLKYTILNTSILEIINKFSETNKIILATNSHKIKADLLLKHYDLYNLFHKKYYKKNYLNKDNKYKYIINNLKINSNNIIIFEDNYTERNKAIDLGVSSKNIINPNIRGA